MEEQVTRREDVQPLQQLGAPRPHTLEVGDGRLERQKGHPSSNSRANAVALKGERSAACSPVPMNFTGTSIA